MKSHNNPCLTDRGNSSVTQTFIDQITVELNKK